MLASMFLHLYSTTWWGSPASRLGFRNSAQARSWSLSPVRFL